LQGGWRRTGGSPPGTPGRSTEIQRRIRPTLRRRSCISSSSVRQPSARAVVVVFVCSLGIVPSNSGPLARFLRLSRTLRFCVASRLERVLEQLAQWAFPVGFVCFRVVSQTVRWLVVHACTPFISRTGGTRRKVAASAACAMVLVRWNTDVAVSITHSSVLLARTSRVFRRSTVVRQLRNPLSLKHARVAEAASCRAPGSVANS